MVMPTAYVASSTSTATPPAGAAAPAAAMTAEAEANLMMQLMNEIQMLKGELESGRQG